MAWLSCECYLVCGCVNVHFALVKGINFMPSVLSIEVFLHASFGFSSHLAVSSFQKTQQCHTETYRQASLTEVWMWTGPPSTEHRLVKSTVKGWKWNYTEHMHQEHEMCRAAIIFLLKKNTIMFYCPSSLNISISEWLSQVLKIKSKWCNSQ